LALLGAAGKLGWFGMLEETWLREGVGLLKSTVFTLFESAGKNRAF
jgi:hypothetical protein